jgi:hypothetical protein
MYGINGLCLSCLRKREEESNEVSSGKNNSRTQFDDKDKILITIRARAYIDFLATNDRTSRTYNPGLNDIVATENKAKYDRIDKCKKYSGS